MGIEPNTVSLQKKLAPLVHVPPLNSYGGRPRTCSPNAPFDTSNRFSKPLGHACPFDLPWRKEEVLIPIPWRHPLVSNQAQLPRWFTFRILYIFGALTRNRTSISSFVARCFSVKLQEHGTASRDRTYFEHFRRVPPIHSASAVY